MSITACDDLLNTQTITDQLKWGGAIMRRMLTVLLLSMMICLALAFGACNRNKTQTPSTGGTSNTTSSDTTGTMSDNANSGRRRGNRNRNGNTNRSGTDNSNTPR